MNRFFIPPILLGLTLGLIFIIVSCKKDKYPVPPAVSLKSGSGYTPDGAVVKVGAPLKFGIMATGNDANITNLVVKKIMPDGTVKVVLDSGLNSSGFIIDKIFYQGVEEEAQWTIQIMDKNRLFATTAITILKDPNSSWGGIFEFGRIIMGYQNNSSYGQFLIPATGKVFFADSAALNQSLIDIITYFFDDENIPSPTFSSPGELGGGITTYYPQIGQWSTLRYTKWDISVDGDPIPTASFDACHNDSLLIVSYDDVWGKRKFKWADAGKVIPFMTASGKKGLVMVLSADHDPAGKIEFALKIQQ
ncbi:MAG: hypothetical protein WCI71_02340 [Bacteroidota bacterium]